MGHHLHWQPVAAGAGAGAAAALWSLGTHWHGPPQQYRPGFATIRGSRERLETAAGLAAAGFQARPAVGLEGELAVLRARHPGWRIIQVDGPEWPGYHASRGPIATRQEQVVLAADAAELDATRPQVC